MPTETDSRWAGGNCLITEPSRRQGSPAHRPGKLRVIPQELNLIGKVNCDDCIAFWGWDIKRVRQMKKDPTALQPYISYLAELKTQLVSKARTAVEEWMVRQAMEEGIKLKNRDVVSTWGQMKVAWKDDGSRENAEKFWNVGYGSVQGDKGSVFLEVEIAAMKMCNVKYQGSKDDRSCLASGCWFFNYINTVNQTLTWRGRLGLVTPFLVNSTSCCWTSLSVEHRQGTRR